MRIKHMKKHIFRTAPALVLVSLLFICLVSCGTGESGKNAENAFALRVSDTDGNELLFEGETPEELENSVSAGLGKTESGEPVLKTAHLSGWTYTAFQASVRLPEKTASGAGIRSFDMICPYRWSNVSSGKTEGNVWKAEADGENEAAYEGLAEKTDMTVFWIASGALAAVFIVAFVLSLRAKKREKENS